jgi:small conductance mechanosensitive channel
MFDSTALVQFWNDWHTLIRIVLIAVGAVALRALLLISVKRVVKGIVNAPNHKNAKVVDSELIAARVVARARTMGSVLSNLITWSIFTLALSAILSELGIAVGALIAGAGVLAAALGFGAQHLVKDMIAGLFIVFEDQYGVGDRVDLGEASGTVENVGLRVTQVRDVTGTLWYVRNGEILRVGNSSQKKSGKE